MKVTLGCGDLLITGGTGFIGSEVLRRALESKAWRRIHVLVRGLDQEDAERRVMSMFSGWCAIGLVSQKSWPNVVIHCADLIQPLQLESSRFNAVTHIIHAAAETHLGESLTLCRRINLFGTQNLLRIARSLPSLQRFVHVSTAFVAGCRRGVIKEIEEPGPFRNFYEKSKYEAETAVRVGGVPFTIVRPSVVVGDSRTGYVVRPRMMYSLIRMWLMGRVVRLPLDPKSRADIVPVDFVTRGILCAALEPRAQSETLHLCAGSGATSPVAAAEGVSDIFGLPRARLLPPIVARLLAHPFVARFLPYDLREVLAVARWHLPYLGSRNAEFSMERTSKVLPHLGMAPSFGAYNRVLWRFCLGSHWTRLIRSDSAAAGKIDLTSQQGAACGSL